MLLSQKLLTSVTTEMLLLGHQCLLLRHIEMSQGTNNLPVGAIWHTPQEEPSPGSSHRFSSTQLLQTPCKGCIPIRSRRKRFPWQGHFVGLWQTHGSEALSGPFPCSYLYEIAPLWAEKAAGHFNKDHVPEKQIQNTGQSTVHTHTFAESCYLDKCYLGKLGNVIDLLCFQETTKTMLLK